MLFASGQSLWRKFEVAPWVWIKELLAILCHWWCSGTLAWLECWESGFNFHSVTVWARVEMVIVWVCPEIDWHALWGVFHLCPFARHQLSMTLNRISLIEDEWMAIYFRLQYIKMTNDRNNWAILGGNGETKRCVTCNDNTIWFHSIIWIPVLITSSEGKLCCIFFTVGLHNNGKIIMVILIEI